MDRSSPSVRDKSAPSFQFGLAGVLEVDGGLASEPFAAVTDTMYATPLISPLITQEVVPTVVQDFVGWPAVLVDAV